MTPGGQKTHPALLLPLLLVGVPPQAAQAGVARPAGDAGHALRGVLPPNAQVWKNKTHNSVPSLALTNYQ